MVRPILEAVRKRGDARCSNTRASSTTSSARPSACRKRSCKRRATQLTPEFREAVETASANIRAFAEAADARAKSATISARLRLGQIVRPLDTVAAYIPAGRYPLPSTLMMTVIPAQVAGVPNVCVASPKPVAEIFGTAALLGVHERVPDGRRAGHRGVRFGTRTVPRADRIVGPGNIYVAAAKKLLAGEVGIDFVAGPTEILIIAADGDPRCIAADMLAQAEHDVDASAILLTTSKRLANAVAKEIERQLATLPTGSSRAQVDRQEQRHHPGAVARRSGRTSATASRPST